MNISAFLQSIITIVFIYLLLSLIASEVQENISSVFELRARRLKQSIQKMLGETNYNPCLTDKLYGHSSISTINQSASSLTSLLLGISFNFSTWNEWIKDGQNIVSSFTWIIFLASILFQWPLWLKLVLFSFVIICRVCFLFFFKSENREVSRKSIGPSYMEAETVAQAIISVIKDSQLTSTDGTVIDDKPIKYLNNLSEDFKPSSEKLLQIVTEDDNWDKFQKAIEELYKEVQERSSGVYKRNAKGLSLILGMAIAIISNADIFNIVQVLNKSNKDYGNQLISKLEKENIFSEARAKDPSTTSLGNELSPSEKEKISAIIQEAGFLPLGWDYNQKLDQELIRQQVESENQGLGRKAEMHRILQSSQSICAKKAENSNSMYDWRKCLESLSDSLKDQPDLVTLLSDDFKNQVKSLDQPNTQKKFPTTYDDYSNTLLQEIEDIKAKKNMEIFNDSSKKKDALGIVEDAFKNVIGLNKNNWIEQTKSWWGKTTILIKKQGGWLNVLFGWFVSASAIAMGAPFWFDILRKIMNFRSTGQEIANRGRIKKIG